MLSRLTKRRGDEGFTLIELLVVIIIIGILAAIAIPVFLNQRRNAWDAAVQADLRNAATAQETFLTDGGLYSAQTPVGAELTAAGFKYSGDENYQGGAPAITVDAVAGDSYCMEAVSASGVTFQYSSPGGLTDDGQAGYVAC